MSTPRILRALPVLALLIGACGGPGASVSTPKASVSPTEPVAPRATASPSVAVAPVYALGDFPAFPPAPLAASTAAALQAALDAAVAKGTFPGVTAAVIVADVGSWAGASGSSGGTPLGADSRMPTHSSAKTIVAAEILRLHDEGLLDLDAPAAQYLPPDLAFFDANGATIRQVLGMRSGIPDLNEYQGYYPAEQASTVEEVFRMLPEPSVSPGAQLHYASTNYVLLGAIVEHLTKQPLADALRDGVLDRPGLDGIAYTVSDALASDGWGVETTPGSLARWGYELYGGFVISDASLQDMTDFKGQWYGLGTMNFADIYAQPAVGHEGESSVTTCCSLIRLVVLPEKGLVISVQADTNTDVGDPYRNLIALSKVLISAALA
jgi:D-alanyl-D-alanine carboxypeptidase